jgi:probable biosynthetic protein (TIGR04098 family)
MWGPVFEYPLTIAIPHTNLNQLAESVFLMHAGHFQWFSLSKVSGVPTSRLRSITDSDVYATYFYVEEDFPPPNFMNTFRLEDECVFLNVLRQMKNISIDGRMLFHRRAELPPDVRESFGADPDSWRGRLPVLRMANIMITPTGGNEYLKIAAPVNASFDSLPTLPLEENAYPIVRSAEQDGHLRTITERFQANDRREDFDFLYTINPDRDTNGVGLVYFANYVAFMDMAERRAMRDNAVAGFTAEQIDFRTLRRREIAYYANARIDDTVRVRIRMFRSGDREVAFSYRLTRESDGRLIALSEAIKVIPA